MAGSVDIWTRSPMSKTTGVTPVKQVSSQVMANFPTSYKIFSLLLLLHQNSKTREVANMAANQALPLEYRRLLNKILVTPIQESNALKSWQIDWATMRKIDSDLTKTYKAICEYRDFPQTSGVCEWVGWGWFFPNVERHQRALRYKAVVAC